VNFHYSDAYAALKQLRKHRLVTRRYLIDEFGDVTNKLVYAATPAVDTDALEALYNAPTVDEPR
jgi:hypothetical protein